MKAKISQGKIILENKVIDLSNFKIRPKINERDLERYYDSFIEHIGEVRDYFEDGNAFDRAVNDAAHDKRPKLIARETKYPFMWIFRTSIMPFDFLTPSSRRLHDYFIAAHCITRIPRKQSIKGGESKEKSLDEKLREDINEKFKQYPNYEGIIEIPNDNTLSETKSSTFHEALHYVITRCQEPRNKFRGVLGVLEHTRFAFAYSRTEVGSLRKQQILLYQAETDRNFVNTFIREDLPLLEKYWAEHIIHEKTVEMLTDKLLIHDPDAQFENRWSFYSLNNGFKHLALGASAIATGLLLGFSIGEPYLLPFALVPGRIRDYAIHKHKNSKRHEILKPIEYPNFKI